MRWIVMAFQMGSLTLFAFDLLLFGFLIIEILTGLEILHYLNFES